MRAQFNFPTKILFGQGVIQELAAQLHGLGGKRPLVVTDQGLVSTDIPERILANLKAGGMQPGLFDQVEPNPNDAQVDAGALAFETHRADCIVAVGGGSPIDAAKAIQIRLHHKEPLENYDDLKNGHTKILGPLPFLVAVPTTAGTGSEVSRSAVITVRTAERKVVLFSPRLLPAVAVCDPELTYGLPPRITAETGMDALSHNLEAFLASGYHPMADAIAIAGIRMVTKNLPTAVEDGKNVIARQEMLMASTMGAVAFQKGLGVIHSLTHPLSSVAGLSHGLANAIMMPHAIRFNAEKVNKHIINLAPALGTNNLSTEAAGLAVKKLSIRIGLPSTLAQAGVSPDRIPSLVEKSMQDGCHTGNPRKCLPEDMQALFEAAM